MSDMAYIMETQDPHELWLVDGENKFKVSRDMYWLLASEGADLPPKHHITELLNENDKLRELVRDALTTISWCTIDCCPSDSKKRELNERARKLGVEVDK